MTIIRSVLRVTLAALAAATISACASQAQQEITLPRAPASPEAATAEGSPPQADRDSSRMVPGAAHDLLYVTNNYDVTVYSYPGGKLVGKLRHHFQRPVTACSDKAGHVYITDGDNIFVYAHGGKEPLRTLTFSGYLTVGCSSDPTTGNLAVTYELGVSKAYVAVYQQAQGKPILYQDGNLIFAYCGYDAAGNLYVDGTYGGGEDFAFVELPKGSSKLEMITLNQTFQSPGIVQWDGKYITVGDNQLENIYRFVISGSEGTLVGTTSLGGAPDMAQWWIEGDKVIGGAGIGQAVYYWDYPAGGNPVGSITKGVLYPFGVTVSSAKSVPDDGR
jgi:hypothetical protein